MDGGFSDNLPQPFDNTYTVSPFKGEYDICPSDGNQSFMQVEYLVLLEVNELVMMTSGRGGLEHAFFITIKIKVIKKSMFRERLVKVKVIWW